MKPLVEYCHAASASRQLFPHYRRTSPAFVSTLEGAQLGDLGWPYARILNVVLTYGGAALDGIERKLIQISDAGRPDVYLDLTKGILIKNEGLLFTQGGFSSNLRFDDAAVGLARLPALLSKVTGRLVMRGVKWNAYIS